MIFFPQPLVLIGKMSKLVREEVCSPTDTTPPLTTNTLYGMNDYIFELLFWMVLIEMVEKWVYIIAFVGESVYYSYLICNIILRISLI